MDGYDPYTRFNHNDFPLVPTTGAWPTLPEVPIYGEDIPVPDSLAGAADTLSDIDTSDLGDGYLAGEDTTEAIIEDDATNTAYDYPYTDFGAEIPEEDLAQGPARSPFADDETLLSDSWLEDGPITYESSMGAETIDFGDVDATGEQRIVPDMSAETSELPVEDYGEVSSSEVAGLYNKLQDRLATETYDDNGRYAEIDTSSGSVVVTDSHKTDHTSLGDDFVEAETAGTGFNEARWSETLLRTHTGILSISVQDGHLDDLMASETNHYIVARPCDLDPKDDSLGTFMAETLADLTPATPMASSVPVMLNLSPDKPTGIVTDISHDPVLQELYNQLMRGRDGETPL
jgi:hypothetical protein